MEKVVKYNIGYIIGSYVGYFALMGLLIAMGGIINDATILGVLALVPMALIIWGPSMVFKMKSKNTEAELKAKGFTSNYTFNSTYVKFYMDFNTNQMALRYIFNPFKLYVMPLSEAKNPRVNDFKSGKGIMEGSNMVALEFDLYGKRQRVHTFFARKGRFAMNSNQILDGIAKADMMCERILAAQMGR